MLATDWSRVAGVPADLVRAGVSLSGVFDLPPLIGTSLNEALRLDAQAARAASPLFWPPPPKGRTLVAAVGGAESAEFLRQSRDIVAAWKPGRLGVRVPRGARRQPLHGGGSAGGPCQRAVGEDGGSVAVGRSTDRGSDPLRQRSLLHTPWWQGV